MSIESLMLDLGMDVDNCEKDKPELMVQDRKTGEFYNPQERFDQLMNKPEIQAVFKRLAVR